MNTFIKHASIVSALALMTVGSGGVANAQSKTYGGQSNYCAENPDSCGPKINKPGTDEQAYSKKRRIQRDDDQAEVNETSQPRQRQARSDWKFDSNRHERRRDKDDRFRFSFGEYWYPEPYWLGYGLVSVPYRVGCAEGRRIVRDRGFNRVRTVECQGRTFTYVGRRHGDSFRVFVSSRSGRIVEVDRI
jgi:hypothetical protein